MKSLLGTSWSARLLATTAAASILIGGAVPTLAQESADSRLAKAEAEIRALQRKVFPGPDGKYFEPEIAAAKSAVGAVTSATGQPASTPVTDLLTRMDALEAQMARLTSQVEQNTNRINLIETKLGMGQPAAAPNAPATTPATTPPPASTPTTTTTPATPPAPKPAVTTPAATTPAATTPAPKPAAPAATRVEAVKAIVKPQSSDPGDDEYSYGYRLWEAKFYPEAQQQLKLFLQKYPQHGRVSYGRNLLGRAYLDDGNPGEAAKWFLQNYQAGKTGDRAPDSLLYLAVTMKQMKDSKRACIALAEFGQTYAAEAAGRLKGLYDSTRNGLACG